jgi:hypothetical protein
VDVELHVLLGVAVGVRRDQVVLELGDGLAGGTRFRARALGGGAVGGDLDEGVDVVGVVVV